jgi:hypothetical protein
MTVSYRGLLSLGEAFPIGLQATAAVLVPLQAKLAGLLQLTAQLTVTPPSLTANLTTAAKILASLQVSPGLPGFSAKAAGVASLLAGVRLQIEAVLVVQSALGVGVHLFIMAGKAGLVGGEFASELVGGRLGDPALTPVFGVCLMANTPAAESSLRTVFSL